jgi:hypothetical protein
MILGPWALYWFALTNINGRPTRAWQATFNPEDAEALGQELRVPLPFKVEPLSPHSYLWAVLTNDSYGKVRDARLAWMVAGSYNVTSLQSRGHGWWHFSGAALTIWLTRNWTTDELVAKGIELRRTRKPRAAR